MRLGLLGPADGDLGALAQAADFLLNGAGVARAFYLGADDALEQVVERWAESIVGPQPDDDTLWDRVYDTLLDGTAEELDLVLRAERARLRLKALEVLPSDALRSVEMVAGHVAVLIHDKALLDEEDIYSATFLVYGKSDGPLVKRIGNRWFLTPGPLSSGSGGAMVLEEGDARVTATVFSADGKAVHAEPLMVPRVAKLRV